MTRVSAANGDACPEWGQFEALSGEAGFRFAGAWARRPARRLTPALKRPGRLRSARDGFPRRSSSPSPIAIFGILALTLQHLRLERDMALQRRARARSTCARRFSLERLEAALRADPQASEAEIFRTVLDAHPDERLAAIDPHRPRGAAGRIRPEPRMRPTRLWRPSLRAQTPPAGGSRLAWFVSRTERGEEQFAAVRALPDSRRESGLCFIRRSRSLRLARRDA